MAEPSLQDVTVHFGYVAEKAYSKHANLSELSTMYRDLDYYKRCKTKLEFDRMFSECAKLLDSTFARDIK